MKNIRFISLFLIFAFILSCKENPSGKTENYYTSTEKGVKTGGIKMISIDTPKGKLNVWTKTVGNNPKIKVLLLNGGPGATHEYFECFDSFLPAENIEYIYYDQIGCGNSDNPNDVSIWDLPRYVEEVEQVRKALNLNNENFFLLGHSWGGILAMQYALKYQKNLKGLIISNMMSSCPDYGKYAEQVLAKQMKPEIVKEIKDLEKNKQYSNPRYMELLIPNFYEKHILRFPAKDWPEPVNRSFAKMNESLYVTMQGPSEFGLSGKLEKWDVKSQLKNILVPTLVIGAQYDTMDPKHMEWMSKEFPKGKYLYCKNGSHMSMYDDQETYMKGLIQFLKEQE